MQNREESDLRDFKMRATTLFGCEDLLAEELLRLGAKEIIKGNRSVEFVGDKKLMYEANLWCRTAIRILRPLKTFPVRNEKDLYDKVGRIFWSKYFDIEDTFAVSSVVNKSTFTNSLFVSMLAKDAIVDQFRNKFGERPSVDVANPDVQINLHINDNIVTVSLDSSGESLHKRGYRSEANIAPLSEVLAASMILLSGWDKKKPLIDPMCGSGTILTEAALIALNRAPGLYRENFAFMNWKDFDSKLFFDLKRKAKAAEYDAKGLKIFGTEIDPRTVAIAESNIRNAGLDKFIDVKQADFFDEQEYPQDGIIIMNPPYGERIMDKDEDTNQFYKRIGDVLKSRCNGYEAYILTGNLEAAKHVGLRTSRKTKLFNGPIECRLLKYELYQGSRKRRDEFTDQIG